MSEKTTAVAQTASALTMQDVGLTAEQATSFSPATVAQAVRVLLQNWRQGTVGCKDRSALTSRSNRKPWKQKGTGRARAGTPRSPIWRGGAVSHGPQARVRTLGMTRKMVKNALQHVFFDKLQDGSIFQIDWNLASELPKTAAAQQALKAAGLSERKVLLFVSHEDQHLIRSFGNLPNVGIIAFDQPNVYALANAECWIYLKKDAESFKQMVHAWI